MFKLRLLDRAAYQTAVEALDAFFRGDARLLVPLLARCQAQLQSEQFARRHWLSEGLGDSFAEQLDKATAGGDPTELPAIVISCTAMPEYQLTWTGEEDDSPNVIELTDDRVLYDELDRAAPWLGRLWIERFRHDCEPYADGLSMFLFKRDDLLRLQEALHKIDVGPSSHPQLRGSRDRLLDLIGRCLADERMAIAVCDFG